MLLSLHVLGEPSPHLVFESWRARTLRRLTPASRMLLHLAPPRGYSPDFLTPAPASGIDSLVDAVLSTSRQRLRAELTLLGRSRASRVWGRLMPTNGDTEGLQQLGKAMRHYYQQTLAASWSEVQAVVAAERADRGRDLMDGGTERLLNGLYPWARWERPVLAVDYPVRQDLDLQGRGLLLIPSYFCWARPIALLNSQLPPVLVYPANHSFHLLNTDALRESPQALARLIGRTRASILEAIADVPGMTGNDISRHLRLSAATVSEHASVLREAGLIYSKRTSVTVSHSPTPLGRSLLEGPMRDREGSARSRRVETLQSHR